MTLVHRPESDLWGSGRKRPGKASGPRGRQTQRHAPMPLWAHRHYNVSALNRASPALVARQRYSRCSHNHSEHSERPAFDRTGPTSSRRPRRRVHSEPRNAPSGRLPPRLPQLRHKQHQAYTSFTRSSNHQANIEQTSSTRRAYVEQTLSKHRAIKAHVVHVYFKCICWMLIARCLLDRVNGLLVSSGLTTDPTNAKCRAGRVYVTKNYNVCFLLCKKQTFGVTGWCFWDARMF